MNNKQLALVGSLALAAVIGGAAVLYSTMGDAPTTPVPAAAPAGKQPQDSVSADTDPKPEPAPDFTVLDRDGNEVKLSDSRGKPVVVSFWASWCGVCKTGMPDFEEAYAAYGDNVHFMMVNLTAGSETQDVARTYIEEKGYTFPIYFDTEMSAASAYGVNAVPVTYLVDAEGNLVAYGQGRLGLDGIEQGIEMAQGATLQAES